MVPACLGVVGFSVIPIVLRDGQVKVNKSGVPQRPTLWHPRPVSTTNRPLMKDGSSQQQHVVGDDVQGQMDYDDEEDEDAEMDVEDFEFLFKEPPKPLTSMEKAWRYAKKPLLSIGAKGATLTHGNSLRQLLQQHTVVKVKVNTRRFDDSLEEAFVQLRDLAQESGAPEGIEMLQAREAEKIILFGMPGTAAKIQAGEFPPQP